MDHSWGIGTAANCARLRGVRACVAGVFLLGAAAQAAQSPPELVAAEKLFETGQYDQCLAACKKVLPAAAARTLPASPDVPLADAPTEGWWVLAAKVQLQTGKYEEAAKTTQAGLEDHEESLTLYWLRRQALLYTGKEAEAKALVEKVTAMLTDAPWRYADTDNRVAAGRFMLVKHTDARKILETYYDKARRDDPVALPPLLAIAELGLAKNDPGVAAEACAAALKVSPENADVLLAMARAQEDDPDVAAEALAKALEVNPNHVDTMLELTDRLLDRERYEKAGELLGKVLAVNPLEPRAWAYQAVMGHLKGDYKAEAAAREKALSTWKSNPEVDYIIGRKLSQKYRFEVGTDYQKKALAMDAEYEPAQFQLCQDLLRMGKEDEGWKLADAVFKADPYNVVAYNLVTLHDRLERFKTLSNDRFVVRMDAKESPIYGRRVLDLLSKAHEKLCAKYGVELAEPTTVEVFPLQQDFEIRTFGFPGEEGFLGVCFGRVVTVNSPASRLAHPTSWEAVVWHEFCHTVTLTKTHNKMPRWISEGISTYEERQANAGWGEHMEPAYRQIIEKNGAAKIREMSDAFSNPPSPMALEFAYFEASMVVQYVVERYGLEALKGVLTDLGNDVQINESLAKRAAPIDKLDADFAVWLKKQADDLAPQVNWEEPKLLPEDGSGPLVEWNKAHPGSFWGLVYEGEAFLVERKYAEATVPLREALRLFPEYAEADGPYGLLAKVYQELHDAAGEKEILTRLAERNADVVMPRLRLLELAAKDKNWKLVRDQALAVIGVDPLVLAPYTYLADAAEELGDRTTAIDARRTVLLLKPLDKPEQHYRLAKVLFADGKLAEARREVVLCLEDAPRYRAALNLLLEIATKMDATGTGPAPAGSEPAAKGGPQ